MSSTCLVHVVDRGALLIGCRFKTLYRRRIADTRAPLVFVLLQVPGSIPAWACQSLMTISFGTVRSLPEETLRSRHHLLLSAMPTTNHPGSTFTVKILIYQKVARIRRDWPVASMRWPKAGFLFKLAFSFEEPSLLHGSSHSDWILEVFY